MSPSPLGSHNHSQTHLKLSERLPLWALVSADLHTAKSLKTFWNLDLSLSRTSLTCKSFKPRLDSRASRGFSRKNAKLLQKIWFQAYIGGLVRAHTLSSNLNCLGCITVFWLSALVSLSGWAKGVRLMTWSGALSEPDSSSSSSFFLALNHWVSRLGMLAKPTNWLIEKVKTTLLPICLINLKLREIDY